MSFESLPLETLYQIFLNSPYKSVVAYCLTRKEYNYLCSDFLFWREKTFRDLGVSFKDFENELSKIGNPRRVYWNYLNSELEEAIIYNDIEKYK